MVRAKMICNSVTEHASYGPDVIKSVVLAPVTSDDSNKDWSKYTPNGKLELTITNENASMLFKAGSKYYIDISEVTE